MFPAIVHADDASVRKLYTLKYPPDIHYFVNAFAVNHDTRLHATSMEGDYIHRVRLYEIRTGKLEKELVFHGVVVYNYDLSRFAVIYYFDGNPRIEIYESDHLYLLHTILLDEFPDRINGFTPDGRHIVAHYQNPDDKHAMDFVLIPVDIGTFDVKKANKITIRTWPFYIPYKNTDYVLNWDGSKLIYKEYTEPGRETGDLVVRNTKTGEVIGRIPNADLDPPYYTVGIAYHAEKKLVAFENNDLDYLGITVYDDKNDRVLHTLVTPPSSPGSMSYGNLFQMWFTPNGQKLIATYGDKKIRFWNVSTGKLEYTYPYPEDAAVVAVYDDRVYMEDKGTLVTVDLKSYKVSKKKIPQEFHGDASKSGQYVVEFNMFTQEIKVWDTSNVLPQIPLSVPAVPTEAKVLIDGREVAFEAYNLDNNNYFKLRDLAMALRESGKPFAVKWDGESGAIRLETGKTYMPVGGELAASGKQGVKGAYSSLTKLVVDGREMLLTAYTIDGYTYFKLRDLAPALQLDVKWDGKANAILIDTK